MKRSLCKSWPKMAIVFFSMLLITVSAYAQNRVITGKIVDNNGEPVAGANVIIKGTSEGTMSDIDGNFTLSVPNKAVLHVSFIGYIEQEVAVAGKNTLNILLKEDNKMLEEVVAIGYGTAKKGSLTGAVAKVSSEKLAERPVTGVASALQGQMAGVEVRSTSGAPGQETKIRVRGAASIHADSDPLYVVDGIPTDNLNSINPADIESIEVLKDASSSAIYGSRGANGVVLVTTKHGKTGHVKVDFSANWGWQQMEKKIDVASAEEYIWMRKYTNNKAYLDKYEAKGATINDDWNTRLGYTGSVNVGMMNDPRWDNGGKGVTGYGAAYEGDLTYLDWQDEFFRVAALQQYQLAVSGGTENTTYRMSAGWLDQDGIAVGTGYKRLTVRANIDSQVNKWFKFGVSVAPTLSWANGGNVDNKDSQSHKMLCMVPIAEAAAGALTGSNPYLTYSWAGTSVSPVAFMEQATNKNDAVRMLTSAYMKFDLTHGFTASVTGSWNYYDNEARIYTPDNVASTAWSTSREGTNSSASRTDSRVNKLQIEALVNYARQFGKHDVQAMLGWGNEEARGWSTSISAQAFSNNNLESFNNNTTTIKSYNADVTTRTRLVSFFGRAQYGYDERYNVSFSLRRDGSSKFGANAKWGWFPAVSAGWRISNEKFWPEDFWMNNLKVRASWGMNGNNSIPATAAYAVLSTANTAWGNAVTAGKAFTSGANPDLGWEKTNSWNVALDLGFLENRITFSADYYQKRTTDLLYQVSVPAVLGFTTKWGNVGEIENKGVEFELGSTNIRTRNFEWSMNVNIGLNSNKIVELAEHQSVEVGSWGTQILAEGQPLKSFYLYDAIGVFDEEKFNAKNADGSWVYPRLSNQAVGDVIYRDVNGDGKISEKDKDYCGSAAPKMTYGWTNRFKLYDFDLSVLLTGQAGGKVYGLFGRAIDRAGMSTGGNVLQHWANGWYNEKYMTADMKKEYEARGGWNHSTPALKEGQNGTSNYDTRWLYSSDFIKIKNITLGWNCPCAKKLGLQSLRVYASVENVFMWDHYDYYSPEIANSSAPNTSNGVAGDVDYGAYPNARTYSFGVNVTF